MAATAYVGSRIKRVEEPALITGAGHYLDDITLPGMTHAVILHSPHAHIKRIDTSKAQARPGVVAVFTGQDMAAINSLPCAWQAGDMPLTPERLWNAMRAAKREA